MFASAIFEIGRRGGIDCVGSAFGSAAACGAANDENALTALRISEMFMFSGRMDLRSRFFSAGSSDKFLSPSMDKKGREFGKFQRGLSVFSVHLREKKNDDEYEFHNTSSVRFVSKVALSAYT